VEINFTLQEVSFLFFLKSDSVLSEIVFEVSFSEISNVSSNGEQFAEEEIVIFKLLRAIIFYTQIYIALWSDYYYGHSFFLLMKKTFRHGPVIICNSTYIQ